MLRRLTVMVFALGVLLAMTGTLWADQGTLIDRGRIGTGAEYNVSKMDRANPFDTWAAGLNRPTTEGIREVTEVPQKPQTAGVDTTACFMQDYFDYANSFDIGCYSVGYFDIYGGTDPFELGMRYDIPKNHFATLTEVWVWIGESSANVGTGGNLQVRVYDDIVDGHPNSTYVHEEIVDMSAYNPIPWSGGWIQVPIDGGAGITISGTQEFVVSVSTVGDASDYLEVIFDSPTGCPGVTATGRSQFYYPGTGWFTFGEIFSSGIDRNMALEADYCVEYSSCYTVNPVSGGGGSVSIWQIPDPYWTSGNILTGMGNEVISPGPDTIKTVYVIHLLHIYAYGVDLAAYDGTSTNGIDVKIWPDDGAGNIDMSGGPLAVENIPGGLANIFPRSGNVYDGISAWEVLPVDFTSHNLVMLGKWHMTFEMTSSDELDGAIIVGTSTAADGLTGGSAGFVGATPMWESMATQSDWAEGPYGPRAIQMYASLCRDEFYDCGWYATFTGGSVYGVSGPLACATKVTGKPVNKLDVVSFFNIDPWLAFGDTLDDGSPVPATYEIDPLVFASTLAGPGAELWRGTTLAAGDLAPIGWNDISIPGSLVVLGDFYIGYSDVTTDPNSYIYYGQDPTGASEVNDGLQYTFDLTNWGDLSNAFGGVRNLFMYAYFCSIIPDERPCLPGDDWVTVGHDFARTNASGNAIEDAWCDLTINGMWEHPLWAAQRSNPIIYDNRIVMSFSSGTQAGYYIFDLQNLSAGPIDSISSFNYPDYVGGSVRCTPTIAEVGGTPMLFLAGGVGLTAVSAWDISTNPATYVWSANALNNYNGFNYMSTVRYGVFLVLNDGTDDVLYFMDDEPFLYAVYAATGLPYAGWSTNPIALSGPSYKGLATDGSLLFLCMSNTPYGNVYAYTAAGGAYVWDLVSGSGLQAAALFPNVTSEVFAGGISYGDGEVYTNSSASGDAFTDGVFYRLSSSSGAILSASMSITGDQLHPVVDANNVYMLGLNGWISAPPLGGTALAFSRTSGAITWAYEPPAFDNNEGWFIRGEPVLTCEPNGVADVLFGFNAAASANNGYLCAINADNGAELFTRRVDHGAGANRLLGGALAPDALGDMHLVFADEWGTIYDLTKQADRPRLALLASSLQASIPFGTGPDTVVVFEDVYMNQGCEDLVVTLTADEASNGSLPLAPRPRVGTIRRSVADMADDLVDRMTDTKFTALRANVVFDEQEVVTRDYDRTVRNTAAMAVPNFLVEVGGAGDVFEPAGGNFVTAPGEMASIAIHVNGPNVNRGPNNFYIEFTTHNDPDYFLNGAPATPEIFVSLIGGCLYDTTWVNFGPAGANHMTVSNSTRMGLGDYTADVGILAVNGIVDGFYQGFYGYGVSQRRLAINTHDWWSDSDSASAEANSWWSVQPDPNWCDGLCKPHLSTGVTLGQISSNGIDYRDIIGNVVCVSWLDSVQNFDDGLGGWDWELYHNAPFDNDSTMGLYCNQRVIGVLDDTVSAGGYLNNMAIYVFEMSERNGNAVPDWKFGQFVDYDFYFPIGGSYDSTQVDQDVSSGWIFDGGMGALDAAMGVTKIPFGCGYEPLINGVPIERAQSVTEQTDRIYFDSLYFYFSLPAGVTYGHDQATADDQDAIFTHIAYDFEPYDTMTFGVAQWLLEGLTDASTSPADPVIADAANLLNKFAGFGRGDVNDDGGITLADIIYLADYVNGGGSKPGPVPFMHLGDVNGDTTIDLGDVNWLIDYYFNYVTDCPAGDWVI